MSLSSVLSELRLINPLMSGAVEAAVFVVIALLLWIFVSIPAGLFFIALHKRLKLSYQTCKSLYHSQVGIAKKWPVRAQAIREEYWNIIRKTLQPFDKFIDYINTIKIQTEKLNKDLVTEIQGLSSSLSRLKNQPHIDIKNFQFPDYNPTVQADLTKQRRSAATILIIAIIILIALVSVNTSMLSLFFEGLIDDYIIYSIGLKIAHVLAFFFSLLEVALGVFFYYAHKHQSQNSIATPLLQTVVVLFVVGLGLIESFLYLSLSVKTASITFKELHLLQGFELYEAVWLTPLGFIIVGVLAFIGHLLIKGLDDFREAKCTINTKSIMKQIQDVKIYCDNLKKISKDIESSSDTLSDYEKQLNATEQRPIWLQQAINDGMNEINNAIKSSSKQHDEAYDLHEAKRAYYSNIAFSLGCFVTLLLIIFLQGNLIDASKLMSVSVQINYAVAIVLGVGGLLAGYSFCKSLSLSANSKYLFILLVLIMFFLVITLFAVLIPFNPLSEYLILCLIEILFFSILFAFGRKIDTYCVIMVILMKIFACFVIATFIWIVALLIYIIGCLSMVVYYGLYLLGFPLLAVVKRRFNYEEQ
jgi:hypothetical protein